MMVWFPSGLCVTMGLFGLHAAFLAVACRDRLGAGRAQALAAAGLLWTVLCESTLLGLLVGPALLDEVERRREGRRGRVGALSAFSVVLIGATAAVTRALYLRTSGPADPPRPVSRVETGRRTDRREPIQVSLPGHFSPAGSRRRRRIPSGGLPFRCRRCAGPGCSGGRRIHPNGVEAALGGLGHRGVGATRHSRPCRGRPVAPLLLRALRRGSVLLPFGSTGGSRGRNRGHSRHSFVEESTDSPTCRPGDSARRDVGGRTLTSCQGGVATMSPGGLRRPREEIRRARSSLPGCSPRPPTASLGFAAPSGPGCQPDVRGRSQPPSLDARPSLRHGTSVAACFAWEGAA